MPYISLDQLSKSLEKLSSIHPFFGTTFLAFKSIDLPVGETVKINFTKINEEILDKFYTIGEYLGYYSPFMTSDKSNRWQKPRYASTTLQRIAKDTFSGVLIHPTKQEWGWKKNYIKEIHNHLNGTLLPIFDLAVWIYKDDFLEDRTTKNDLITRFISDFSISKEEFQIFDFTTNSDDWLDEFPNQIEDVVLLIGRPKDAQPDRGAALSELILNQIGPADRFVYEPSERLNIITGDNSLGKTFLLEAIWWALTNEWTDKPLEPRIEVASRTPYISFKVNIGKRERSGKAVFNWKRRLWSLSSATDSKPGLSIYARHDGSFVVWDPLGLAEELTIRDSYKQIHLDESEVWRGKNFSDGKGWVCNGIIRDWVTWQVGGERYADKWSIFKTVLKTLSPLGERLEVGEPFKDPFNDAELPTLRMPYGDIPAYEASAGVKRAIALSYCLVWSWYRHLDLGIALREQPERRIILLVDEAEAHLHPKWQRTVIPSLMKVMDQLYDQATPQLHIATHSPMVMASIEPIFDYSIDGLHHLKLENYRVALEEMDFIKRGRADLWLMSDVFGLGHARSVEAEEAIEQAKSLQLRNNPSEKDVHELNKILNKVLAPDDDFWPRWRGYALKYGVE